MFTEDKWRNEFGALSNTLYRLAKPYDDNKHYWVYDFHKGENGNCWVQYYDRTTLDEDGRTGAGFHSQPEFYYLPSKGIRNKDAGNEKYKRLLADGYFLVGKFEQDICGRVRRATER